MASATGSSVASAMGSSVASATGSSMAFEAVGSVGAVFSVDVSDVSD